MKLKKFLKNLMKIMINKFLLLNFTNNYHMELKTKIKKMTFLRKNVKKLFPS